MKRIRVELEIELYEDMVKEKEEEGWDKDEILREIKKHIEKAIGYGGIDGGQYIQDIEVISVSEV